MDKEKMLQERLEQFAAEYMEKLFYFCLKKTGSNTEAEDLASEIALHVVAGLRRGVIPVNFSAWVWTIARNRYATWADQKHKQQATVCDQEVENLKLADDTDILGDLIHAEDLALLRREFAFISRDYREIVVAYYMDGRRVRDIAHSLSLSETAVKQRLYRARSILKEGMTMAREFGPKSYKPEEVYFCASGNQPSGLPWTVVDRQIPKNILLHASNNPCTIEELALELGIAVPYMEEEVTILKNATLLKDLGGKYITDFFIADRECQLDIYHVLRRNSKQRSQYFDAITSDVLPKARTMGIAEAHITDDIVKWWLLLDTIDHCVAQLEQYSIALPTPRANGETWGFVGYETVELPEIIRMGHNGCGCENLMCWFYKIGDYTMWDQVGEMRDWNQAVLLADAVIHKRPVSAFSKAEQQLWNTINGKWAHEDENGQVKADILMVRADVHQDTHALVRKHKDYAALMQQLHADMNGIIAVLKRYSHKVLSYLLEYCASMFILSIRMMTVHDLVETDQLIIPEDTDRSTAGMAMIYT